MMKNARIHEKSIWRKIAGKDLIYASKNDYRLSTALQQIKIKNNHCRKDPKI